MNRNRMRILVTLGIALVFPVGCQNKAFQGAGGGHHYGTQPAREFDVSIYADPTSTTGGCLLDWPVATLWRNQTVKWFSDDGLQYTIDFTKGQHGSPFQNGATFIVPAGGSISSGTLKSQQQAPSQYYDFAVYMGNASTPCKDPSDPGYYVR